MKKQDQPSIEVVPRIADIPAEAWDACANPDPALFNPFVAHGFLRALEDAGTVGGRSGWTPRHLVLRDGQARIAGCAPCYLKSHSQGEYVFDHSWADAYARAGGSYYPKLQIAVPFTPVPGRRLLVLPGPDAAEREALLAAGAADARRAQPAIGGARHLPERGRVGSARRPPLPQADRPAVPLEQRGLRHLRGFPGLARLAQAQGGAQGARGGAEPRSCHRVDARPRDHRGALGCVLRLLHGYGLAQVGPALSQPPGLLADRRRDGRALPADDRAAGREADRRLAAYDRRRLPLRPLLGRRSSTTPACTSSSATTRRSTMRSSTRLRASRPAPRASTSWRAAICRPRPIRRTTSPTRRCAAPSPTISCASAPMWMRRSRSSANTRPSASRPIRCDARSCARSGCRAPATVA